MPTDETTPPADSSRPEDRPSDAPAAEDRAVDAETTPADEPAARLDEDLAEDHQDDANREDDLADHEDYDEDGADDRPPEHGVEAALQVDATTDEAGTDAAPGPAEQPAELAAPADAAREGEASAGAEVPATVEPSKPGWLAALGMGRKRREDEPPGGREMDFLEHLAELRDRLIRVVLLAVLGSCLCWNFYDRQTHIVLLPGSQSALLRLRVRVVHEDLSKSQPTKVALGADDARTVEGLFERLDQLEERLTRIEEHLGIAQAPNQPAEESEEADHGRSPPPGAGERRLILPSLWGFLTGPVRKPLEDQGIRTVFQSPIEPLLVRIQVVAVAGIIVLSPLIFHQVWAFILPALYAHERRAVRPLIPASFLLFWCGVALAYKVIPIFFLFLLGFATGEAEVLNFVKWYIPFLAKVCLSMGVVFQMPVAFYLLGKIGIITSQGLLRVWRHAIVVIFIIAAIITPTWDPFNLCLMAVPICALYFLSVLLVWFTQRRSEEDEPAGPAG